MKKRKITSALAMTLVISMLTMCSKSTDENGIQFSANLDLTGSSLAGQRTKTNFWFSLDNGATYAFGQKFSPGTKFMVKIVNDNIPQSLNPQFTVDWSGSNPKPSDAAAQNPSFTMQGNTVISAKVTGTPFCPPQPAFWAGNWNGAEGKNVETLNGMPAGSFNGSTDKLVISVDPNNTTNGLLLDNLWGDGTGVIIHFTLDGTSYETQTITIPQQTTSEGGVAVGTGTYEQCTGVWKMTINYTFGGNDTYTWTYTMTRA